ncbi:hypothetical protein ACJMK2_025131, partial [Sinanodonta woodiana]
SCQSGQIIHNGTTGELIACSKCCDTDFCNVGLCGGSNTSISLQCFSCPQLTAQVADCQSIEQCASDSICYAHRVFNYASGQHRYETGCRSKLQCQAIAHVPLMNQCFECCDTPMCNLNKCGNNWTVVMHQETSTAQAHTTLPTTTLSPLPPPHISGPMTINLNADTILSCTSNEPGVTYTWLYQGVRTLYIHFSTLLPKEV